MIDLSEVGKVYARPGSAPVHALKGVTFRIQPGEFVTIRGKSGSGKSSLLNILGCLDRATQGTYRLEGHLMSSFSDRELSHFRSQKIGFIFQSFNLLPRTTALENVEMPMIYAGKRVDRRHALKALERVGLGKRASHFSSELSGGEQQRVAVARALINDPAVLLADEPTGNLDQAASTEVMSILSELNQEGRTVVVVTHDEAIASYAQREILLQDGAVASDRLIHAPEERIK
jgi:putative ABC transport system ATP-binding protein